MTFPPPWTDIALIRLYPGASLRVLCLMVMRTGQIVYCMFHRILFAFFRSKIRFLVKYTMYLKVSDPHRRHRRRLK